MSCITSPSHTLFILAILCDLDFLHIELKFCHVLFITHAQKQVRQEDQQFSVESRLRSSSNSVKRKKKPFLAFVATTSKGKTQTVFSERQL